MKTFPTITYVYDRYKKASANKEAIIEIRITYNRKQKYISTGIKVYPKEWKKDRVVNRKDSIQLNQIIDKMTTDIRQVIYDMSVENNIDIFAIPDRLEAKEKKIITFIEFCRERAEIRKYGKTKDSQERYDRFLKFFIQWGKIKTFEDITETHIIEYDKYLEDKGLKPYSKWNNYHRFLNSFIMDAIDAGHITKNPYRWINIDKGKDGKGIEKYLSPGEFNRIRKVLLPTAKLERVRDLFVFQIYTCLSFSDLRNYSYSRIKTIKGMKVYIGNREKTKKEFIVPLTKNAISILNKYNNRLPVISNVKYNEYLKIVAQAAGIDKPISSHWARHTGATLLLNDGISIGVISKICGHSSTRITEQIYAKLLNETIVEAIKTSHLHRQEE